MVPISEISKGNDLSKEILSHYGDDGRFTNLLEDVKQYGVFNHYRNLPYPKDAVLNRLNRLVLNNQSLKKSLEAFLQYILNDPLIVLINLDEVDFIKNGKPYGHLIGKKDGIWLKKLISLMRNYLKSVPSIFVMWDLKKLST